MTILDRFNQGASVDGAFDDNANLCLIGVVRGHHFEALQKRGQGLLER